MRTVDSRAEKRKNSVKLDKRFSKGKNETKNNGLAIKDNSSNSGMNAMQQPVATKQVNSEAVSSI